MPSCRSLIIYPLAYAAFLIGVLGWTPMNAASSAFGVIDNPAQSYAKTAIERTFAISHIGRIGAMETREELVALYELTHKKEAKNAALTLRGRVIQNTGDGLYIVSCAGIVIAVETSPDTIVAADGSIEILIRPDGFYDYTTPAGALHTIRRYKYQKQPDYELTREDFISRLKHGEVFTIDIKEAGVCRACNGLKTTGSKLDGTSQVCALCNGTGIEQEQPIRYKIIWGS